MRSHPLRDLMLSSSQRSEIALLAGAAAGRPDAVRALLDHAGSVVYGFVYARVGGNAPAAEDLTQETFVEDMKSAHTFRGDAALRTWLCAIARRRVARYYEKERKEELARSGLRVTETEDDQVELRDEITRALAQLPAIHRQVLVMKYLDDLTVEQIAREIGRTNVQVQSLLQRARAGLRRTLEGAHE